MQHGRFHAKTIQAMRPHGGSQKCKDNQQQRFGFRVRKLSPAPVQFFFFFVAMACETKFLDLVSAVYDTPDRVREPDCRPRMFKDLVYMGSFLKLGSWKLPPSTAAKMGGPATRP